MTWLIDKQFSFCYGHRVWSQKLETDYCETGDTSCKCRHLHGHEGLVHIFLESDKLERGMVTDFKHLGWVKNFLDNVIDHKFIVDKNDPMFDDIALKRSSILHTEQITIPGLDVESGCVARKFNLADNLWSSVVEKLSAAEKEILEGLLIVDFVPTSENLCKWLFDIVKYKMEPLGVTVKRVDWFETPKSRSSYSV